MSSTLYRSSTCQSPRQVDDQAAVALARAILTEHVYEFTSDLCTTCRVPLCPARERALKTLGSLSTLPHRRPGATRPERAYVKRKW